MHKSFIILFLWMALSVNSSVCRAQGLTDGQCSQSPTISGQNEAPANVPSGSADGDSRKLNGGADFDDSANRNQQTNNGQPVEIEIIQGFNAKDAIVGTPVRGKLLNDIFVDGVKVASAGDEIDGEISKIWHGKRTIKSYVPTKHFLNAQGRLFITFSRIVGPDHRQLPVIAVLQPNTEVERAHASKLHFVVNRDSELTVKYGIAKYLIIDGCISAGVLASGHIGMLVAPAVTGTVGVLCPSYANGRPVDSTEKQSKVKNFLLGAGRGVPGASIIFGLATKGLDVALTDGDKVKVELKDNSNINDGTKFTDAKAVGAM